ncbi:MAG: 16S rRNA (cytidine(1402)-2'-O)-methyltransferase [Streptococcaceae bacterium]|nr:16S rRNA (cytidine(1402)-2'-O)-methyltransferase [Streptococcaceae bacterium]
MGTLYLVPTPIGNLEDMTFRAVETLRTVDLIAAEDTRNTAKLLNHFEIHTPQESFHEHNTQEKLPKLLSHLRAGKSLAQVSDAGMPSISDPGHELVEAAITENIPVVALPGASAGITALISSGLSPQPYTFYGFLPRKKQQQIDFLKEIVHRPETQIFYESPLRLSATLSNLTEVYRPHRQVCLVRELTKIYEEYRRGTLEELLSDLTAHPAKGECLLIVAGEDGKALSNLTDADKTPLEAVKQQIAEGAKPNDAIKDVARLYGINRQELYANYHGL